MPRAAAAAAGPVRRMGVLETRGAALLLSKRCVDCKVFNYSTPAAGAPSFLIGVAGRAGAVTGPADGAAQRRDGPPGCLEGRRSGPEVGCAAAPARRLGGAAAGQAAAAGEGAAREECGDHLPPRGVIVTAAAAAAAALPCEAPFYRPRPIAHLAHLSSSCRSRLASSMRCDPS